MKPFGPSLLPLPPLLPPLSTHPPFPVGPLDGPRKTAKLAKAPLASMVLVKLGKTSWRPTKGSLGGEGQVAGTRWESEWPGPGRRTEGEEGRKRNQLPFCVLVEEGFKPTLFGLNEDSNQTLLGRGAKKERLV